MATPSAGIGKQRIRGAVGSDDTQRASKKQREPEVWQDGHRLTVPTSRRAPIPARNGSGRLRSIRECQQRQDALIPLLEKRARHRGRALLYPPGIGRSCVFTVDETIWRAREQTAIPDQAVVFHRRPDEGSPREYSGRNRIKEWAEGQEKKGRRCWPLSARHTVSRMRREGPSRPRDEEDDRPALEQGHVDQPADVDEEPTRVDAERPLARVEAARADTPLCGEWERPTPEADRAPAWSEAPWRMRASQGCLRQGLAILGEIKDWWVASRAVACGRAGA